jgi:membrane associated rhomboid family serine protease
MAFLQSRPPREPFLHAPASVLWLIALLAAVHVVIVLLPGTVSDDFLLRLAFVPARYAHGGTPFTLVVPFVSHMFLHADFVHLAVNCLWLLVCGPVVARRYGTLRFLLFFLACGAAGAAAHLAFNWGSPEPVIGASGGISGLMAAAIRMMRWPNVSVSGPLMPVLSRPILIFSGIWIATNIVFGVLGLGAEGDAQIAWQAHLGGYLCGLFLIGLVERLRPRVTNPS